MRFIRRTGNGSSSKPSTLVRQYDEMVSASSMTPATSSMNSIASPAAPPAPPSAPGAGLCIGTAARPRGSGANCVRIAESRHSIEDLPETGAWVCETPGATRPPPIPRL